MARQVFSPLAVGVRAVCSLHVLFDNLGYTFPALSAIRKLANLGPEFAQLHSSYKSEAAASPV